jgi:predicted GIY-YIG superfamily endonuclease
MGWVSPVPETRKVAVYRLFGANGELLYIGSTWDPKRRLTQHKSLKPWWPEVARSEVAWKENRQAAEEAEKLAVALEQPRYNIDFKSLGIVLGWDLTLASYQCAPAEPRS